MIIKRFIFLFVGGGSLCSARIVGAKVLLKSEATAAPPQQQLLPVKSQLWCLPLAAQTLQMIRQTHYMEWQGTASVPPAAMPAEQRANINAVYVGCDKVEASLMTAPDSLSTDLKKTI